MSDMTKSKAEEIANSDCERFGCNDAACLIAIPAAKAFLLGYASGVAEERERAGNRRFWGGARREVEK